MRSGCTGTSLISAYAFQIMETGQEILRKRFPENINANDHPFGTVREQSNAQSSSLTASQAPRESTRFNVLYNRFDLESLLWISICAMMMYYTDFWHTMMYDMRVKR